jgi:hypothetical protein
MRILATSIILGSMVLAGAPPPAAGQSNDDTSRSSFTQHAEYDMHQWQQKVRDFGRHAKATGQQGASTAKHDLDDAFTKAKLAADKLRTVGADGWHGAKKTYQDASHDLADTWSRIKP